MIDNEGRLYPSPRYNEIKYTDFANSVSDEILLQMMHSDKGKDASLYLSKESIIDLESLIKSEIDDTSEIKLSSFIKKSSEKSYEQLVAELSDSEGFTESGLRNLNSWDNLDNRAEKDLEIKEDSDNHKPDLTIVGLLEDVDQEYEVLLKKDVPKIKEIAEDSDDFDFDADAWWSEEEVIKDKPGKRNRFRSRVQEIPIKRSNRVNIIKPSNTGSANMIFRLAAMSDYEIEVLNNTIAQQVEASSGDSADETIEDSIWLKCQQYEWFRNSDCKYLRRFLESLDYTDRFAYLDFLDKDRVGADLGNLLMYGIFMRLRLYDKPETLNSVCVYIMYSVFGERAIMQGVRREFVYETLYKNKHLAANYLKFTKAVVSDFKEYLFLNKATCKLKKQELSLLEYLLACVR